MSRAPPDAPLESILSTLIDYRGKTPTKSSSGVKLITAKVIKGGRIQDGNHEFIAEADYEGWMRRGLPQQRDILITTEAPLGEVAMLRTAERVALAQRVILLRANGEFADQDYLFQALKSPMVQARLYARGTGTTVLGIKQSELRKVEIPLPSLATQRRVGSILSAYDDLIENNTRRIAILEEMARRIYEEWCVRFRYPGHEGVRMVESEFGLMPEGWVAVRIEELLDSWRGGDWGSEEPSGSDTAPVFVIRGTDFDDLAHGTGNRVPARFIEPKSLEKRKLRPFDVVVENSINAKSRSAGKTLLITPGLLKRLGGDAIAASFCRVFRFRDPTLAPLAHQKMRQLFEAGDMAFFQNVAANGIANFQAARFVATQFLLLPIDQVRRKQILEVFSTFTASTYADAISNLRTTRDLLLPKLISGELDVSAMPKPEALAA